MSDLISRQDVMDALCKDCAGSCLPCTSYPCSEIRLIQAIPSAQPEPSEIARDIATILVNEMDMRVIAKNAVQPKRKTGKWIWHPEQKNIYGGKCVECSACGEKYIVQYIEDEKFCRNCGADMRGVEDD